MAGAVGKGSDSLLLPQTPAATGDGSPLCFSALPAPPWRAPPDLTVGWGAGAIAGPAGTELPAKGSTRPSPPWASLSPWWSWFPYLGNGEAGLQ